MQQNPGKSFNLPMMLTFLESKNGNHVVHLLDFDIVSVGQTEAEAWDKARLSVKTYVEFGLSKGWSEYIPFPAPQEYWDKITPDTQTRIADPIMIANSEKKVIAVHESANTRLKATKASQNRNRRNEAPAARRDYRSHPCRQASQVPPRRQTYLVPTNYP
jgi:hypothetical protein